MSRLLTTSTSKKKFGFIVLLLLLVGIGVFFIRRTRSSSATTAADTTQASSAIKSVDLNQEFQFPIKNGADEEVGRIKYSIEEAELRKQIVVQGKTATAIEGKIFLIIMVKIANELDNTIKINTRDYVRLIRNGNTRELLAPEIHNDPVEVLAISTKYTRIGFSINTADRDLSLQIGEIKGPKQTIPLAL